jgi:single-strand selective monofunctional uracil DNA glycosylase
MSRSLIQISRTLARKVERLRFAPPVRHVYNPLRYARAPHEAYLARFGAPPRQVVLLGMNPGPFGMAQTGVPFGDVASVRDWLGIEGSVGKPADEHPKRPVAGFACGRAEVSGTRLWGWAQERFETPERFFARFLVLNYCPLVFLEESGRNRTPDKLPRAEREPLVALCDEALVSAVDLLRPAFVVGVGAFAHARAEHALSDRSVKVGGMLHPSPASPRANRGWAEQAERDLQALGIRL